MKKFIAILLCVATMFCLFAGCGSKGDDKTDEKVWKISTDTVFRPFEYKDASGKLVGIDVEILAAIAEDQGFKYELNSVGWDASIAACQSGQADAMIAGASITEKRKSEGWIFSDGYYHCTQTMTVAADSTIKGFEDLKGKQVAVKTGTMGADYANSLKDKYGFTIASFEDSPTMYQAVIGGQAVACFEDTPIMVDSIKNGNLAKAAITVLLSSIRQIRNSSICLTQALRTLRQAASMTKSSTSTLANLKKMSGGASAKMPCCLSKGVR